VCRCRRGLQLAVAAALALPAPVLRAQADACPRASLPAYAHNDYRNREPLREALALGYRGVEVDVFLIDDVLRIGHDRREAARLGSLEDVYLRPLAALVAQCGALTSDGAPFLLTLELKEESPEALAALQAVLARHAMLFAARHEARPGRVRAAVRAVLVGWVPTGWRDTSALSLGIQARLASPAPIRRDRRDIGAVPLISLDYGKTIGRWWRRRSTRRAWLAALCATKREEPDRWLRAHNVPVDSAVYAELFAHGVDLIGVTELARARAALSVPLVRSACDTPS